MCSFISFKIYSILSDWILHRLKLVKVLGLNLLVIIGLDVCKGWVTLLLVIVSLLQILKKLIHVAHHVV